MIYLDEYINSIKEKNIVSINETIVKWFEDLFLRHYDKDNQTKEEKSWNIQN